MSHIYHGQWVPYTPTELPQGAPLNAMFCKRIGDGQDWYEYVHPEDKFGEGSVIFAIIWREQYNGWVVGPATRDATSIFPPNHAVYEIPNYAGSDPQGDLGNKIYDTTTGEFSDIVQPERTLMSDDPIMKMIAAIHNRLDALERK